MARKKHKRRAVLNSLPDKIREETVTEIIPETKKQIAAPIKESFFSILLGALIVIIIGAIVYNYFSGLNKKGANPTIGPSPQASLEEVSQSEAFKEKIKPYKVLPGDSLWTIAQKFYNDGYKWTEIAKLNKLKNPDSIETGMTLSLPKIAVKEGAITPTALSTAAPKAITGTAYKVSVGDDLWDIAVRACGDGYKWMKLAEDNKLENPDIIHQGNVFKIKCK